MAFYFGQEMLNLPPNAAVNPCPTTLQSSCSGSGILKRQGLVFGEEADAAQVNDHNCVQSQVRRCALCTLLYVSGSQASFQIKAPWSRKQV